MPPQILVVDDNSEVLQSLKLILEESGFHVITSQSGKEALSVLKNADRPPDLIISDIKMPGMDGYELFNNLMENKKLRGIPFIFLTALDSEKKIVKGKALGVDDYLTKPFNEEDLLAVVMGKLKRISQTNRYPSQIKELNLNLDDLEFHRESEKKKVFFLMKWNENYGARLQFSYPKAVPKSTVQDLGQRLMQTAMSLRTDKKSQNKQVPIKGGLSVNLKSIEQEAYIYFDKIQDDNIYMIGIITPLLTYIDTLEIEDLFKEIFLNMKQDTEINIEDYWKKIKIYLNKKNAEY